MTTESLRRIIGAVYFAQQDALVDMFGNQYGAAIATLANKSLLTFAKHTDDPAVREALVFIVDCADERLGTDKPASLTDAA